MVLALSFAGYARQGRRLRKSKRKSQSLLPKDPDSYITEKGYNAKIQKMTPEVRENVLLAVKNGAYPSAAAQFAGIEPNTLFLWIQKGRNSASGPYRQFVRDFEKAAADCEVMVTQRFLTATKHDWKAAKALLELRWPERWSPKREVVVRGPGEDGAIRHVAGLVVKVVPSRVIDAEGNVVSEEADLSDVVGAANAQAIVAAPMNDVVEAEVVDSSLDDMHDEEAED